MRLNAGCKIGCQQVNELLTMCVQEEERLKHEKVESAHLTTHIKENVRKGKNALQVKKKTHKT